MNEQNERDLKTVAPEVSEDTAAQAVSEEPAAQEARENEKSSGAHDEKKKAAPRKGKRKRKKNVVALPVMAALLVVALLFGLVAGYGVGRGSLLNRLKDSEAEVLRLSAALEESMGAPAFDETDATMQDENQEAMDELAGKGVEAGDDNRALMGEDELGGAADAASDAPVVVAEYDGGQLMSDEVIRAYEEQIAGYVFSGYSEDEIASAVLSEVMRQMVSERLMEVHAREMGVYELSAEDEAQIAAEAEAQYNEHLDRYRNFVRVDGMTEEEAQGAAKAYLMEAEGTTYESILEEVREGWWKQKLCDELTRDVKLDEAALQAAYDEKLAEQKESFEAYPDDYEFAQMNGEVILYNLSGYRAVQLLQLSFESDEAMDAVFALTNELASLDAEADAEQIAEDQKLIDGYYAAPEAKAQQALQELSAGAEFEALIDAYGTDEGMRDARIRAGGYYVAQGSPLWAEEIVSAAMGLAKVGDVSAPVRTADGVCIVRYLGDVKAGAVELDEVRDRLSAETLEEMRDDACQTQFDAWLNESNPKYYPERLQ